MLEFETEIDGAYVNGVDMITCERGGLITDFKVMVRPLQDIEAAHRASDACAARGRVARLLKRAGADVSAGSSTPRIDRQLSRGGS